MEDERACNILRICMSTLNDISSSSSSCKHESRPVRRYNGACNVLRMCISTLKQSATIYYIKFIRCSICCPRLLGHPSCALRRYSSKMREEAKATMDQARTSHVLHPVRVARICCPRFVPRVGLTRNRFLIVV